LKNERNWPGSKRVVCSARASIAGFVSTTITMPLAIAMVVTVIAVCRHEDHLTDSSNKRKMTCPVRR
jgi:hypothetical protein